MQFSNLSKGPQGTMQYDASGMLQAGMIRILQAACFIHTWIDWMIENVCGLLSCIKSKFRGRTSKFASPTGTLPRGTMLSVGPRCGSLVPSNAGGDKEVTCEEIELKANIANMYDTTSEAWVKLWGSHFHHGWYSSGHNKRGSIFRGLMGIFKKEKTESKNGMNTHRIAQAEMIEKMMNFCGINDENIDCLDVGCGCGGTAHYLASKYPKWKIHGISLSPTQIAIANQQQVSKELSGEGISIDGITSEELCDESERGETGFYVRDAHSTKFEDKSFDLVYSLESAEHIPRREALIEEMWRVLRCDGTLVLITWTHRDVEKESLHPWERYLLRCISNIFQLPEWSSGASYQRILSTNGWKNCKYEDWTENVKPFLPAVIWSALTVEGIKGVFNVGVIAFKYALGLGLLRVGYFLDTAKFIAITAQKAES